ncbi:hypothetical protein FB384_004456 [Prauserella sediminis]|uniref:SRPBCC family protein n=1 Tax=Prauserella sediminis TaxID=577680 RepID=A0A839XTZ8_9PSEU|nr:SRPBCC family protein [Prauserella sediminis]MBB3665499.1 hypothetical protein [Prauserella sediminis]
MPEARAELASDRSPEELAKRITDYYGIHRWSTYVADTVVDGTLPDTRFCTLATGAQVYEQLVDSGPDFVRYRMLLEEGGPMWDYEAELRVVPAADGGAMLSWAATFQCGDEAVDALTRAVQATFDQGLKDLVSA